MTDGFVDSGGVRLAVRDFGGQGQAIALIHGFYGNLGDFEELGPALARTMRVVAYDQRGHGWSEAGPVSIESYNDDLAAVIAAFDLDDPVLYGASFGSAVALGFLAAGGRAAGFVNEDGRLADTPVDAAVERATSGQRRLLDEATFGVVRAGFERAGPAGRASVQRSVVRRPDSRVELRPTQSDLDAKAAAYDRLGVLDAYRAAKVPVLVLVAEQKPPDDLGRQADELRALAPTGAITVRRFPTGHWISAARPDDVAGAVTEFTAAL